MVRSPVTWTLAALLGTAAVSCDGKGSYPGPALSGRPAAPGVKPLPAGAFARLGTTRLRHGGNVTRIRYSPDGRTIASWGFDSVCRLWDASTGEPLGVSRAWYTDGVFDRRGKHLAMVFGTNVHLVRISDGAIVRRLRDHRREITWLGTAPNNQLITISNDRTARVWDLGSGRQLRKIQLHPKAMQSVSVAALSPDGKRLAVSEAYGRVSLFDPRSGRRTGEIRVAGPRWVNALAFSADGLRLAATLHDFSVGVWDAATAAKLAGFKLPGDRGYWHPARVRFAPDGKHLLVMESGGMLARVDPATGKPLWKVAPRLPAWSASYLTQRGTFALSPDARTVACADGQRIRLRHLATGKELPLTAGMAGHDRAVRFLAMPAGGKALVSAAFDGAVLRWDLASRTARALPAAPANHFGRWIALSPGGRWAASTRDPRSAPADDYLIHLHDVDAGKRAAVLKGHAGPVTGAVFTADGKRLISADAASIRIWDAAKGVQVGRLSFPQGRYTGIADLAVAPDGKLLAAMVTIPLPRPKRDRRAAAMVRPTHASAIHVFDLTARKLRFAAEGRGPFAFSPGRAVLAVAGGQHIRLLDTADGKKLSQIACSPHLMSSVLGRTAALAYAPDGRRLGFAVVTPVKAGRWHVGDHGTVHLFDVESGARQRFDVDDLAAAPSLAFSADGSTLITGSADTSIVLWRLPGRPRRP